MPIKGFIREFQDMRDGLGSISRRSFDARAFQFQRTWSYNVVHHDRVHKAEASHTESPKQESCWSTLPPELLRDIIQRVEERESSWPFRKDVVACASVCKAWREVTKDLVKPPELSGKLTFPASVKQPGPRDSTMQCFIKRDRLSSTYYLYLSLTTTLVDNGKFVLAARKFRRATSSDYIISLDGDDMSRGGDTYVGKLRSNFLGTKFTVYESTPGLSGMVSSIVRQTKRVGPRQHTLQGPTGSLDVAHISYELNMLGTRGPRRMQCILHSIPVSTVVEGGVASTGQPDVTSTTDQYFPAVSHLRSRVTVPSVTSTEAAESSAVSRLQSRVTIPLTTSTEAAMNSSKEETGNKDLPLTLKNKSPRWHEQLQCWCLNFKGRVTVASVKNFQLVAALEPSDESPQVDQDKVLLQFGKIGKDTFTMDYRYPLSAFQAFAICLSSFDTKLARE